MELPNFRTKEEENDFYKIRVESIGLSKRTQNALINASIRSVGGILRKNELSLLDIDGLGVGGIKEIKENIRYILADFSKRKQEIFQKDEDGTLPNDISSELEPFLLKVKDNKVIDLFVDHFKISKETLLSQTRRSEVVEIRNSIVYLLREYYGMSYPAIGRLFNKDHTTIIYSYNKVKNDKNRLKDFTDKFSTLIEKIESIKKESKSLEEKTASNINSDIFIPKSRIKFREISDRNLKALEFYRTGMTLENISKILGITRERVRQIVKSVIIQNSINDYFSNGTVVNIEEVFQEEKKKIINIRKKDRPIKIKKEKKWGSYYYDKCVVCNTTDFHYFRKGTCERCAGSFRGERREKIILIHNNKCDKCGVSRENAKINFGRDLYILKNTDVLCKKCYLSVTGKILGDSRKNRWKLFYK